MSLFSDRVEAWLHARDLTRYQLAKAMGGPGAEDQLRKWLRGDHEPSARSVRRVAAAMGIGEGEFWAGPAPTPAASVERRAGHGELLEELQALTDRVLPPPGDEAPAHDTRRRRPA